MKIKVIKLKPKRQAPRRELTLEQIFRYIPKKHRDKFNPTFFDVDHGYDRPLYFVLLKTSTNSGPMEPAGSASSRSQSFGTAWTELSRCRHE